jgi:hypothetical protein
MPQPTTRKTTRQFNARIRRWRRACRELEEAADDAERRGIVLDLDEEWRAMGRRLEQKQATFE